MFIEMWGSNLCCRSLATCERSSSAPGVSNTSSRRRKKKKKKQEKKRRENKKKVAAIFASCSEFRRCGWCFQHHQNVCEFQPGTHHALFHTGGGSHVAFCSTAPTDCHCSCHLPPRYVINMLCFFLPLQLQSSYFLSFWTILLQWFHLCKYSRFSLTLFGQEIHKTSI